MSGTPTSIVTGAAGFIGSHLCERLLGVGHRVIGVDAFTDYYPRPDKEANLTALRGQPGFELREADLAHAELGALVGEADFILHQAGQPGVRPSWGTEFDQYVVRNVLATQRLLEAARGSRRLQRLVFASSSSVYGQARDLPLREDSLPQPFSPYGVTKLAAEHLCLLYHQNFGVPTVALRYFTVYGPRQRPDMGFRRFIRAALEDRPIPVYGDGEQTRDFTYVADAVEANLLALTAPVAGRVFNIGGGSRVSLNEILRTLEEVLGQAIRRAPQVEQPGDVRHTWADTARAREHLGFAPRVSLRVGLEQQVAWARQQPGEFTKRPVNSPGSLNQ